MNSVEYEQGLSEEETRAKGALIKQVSKRYGFHPDVFKDISVPYFVEELAKEMWQRREMKKWLPGACEASPLDELIALSESLSQKSEDREAEEEKAQCASS